MATIENTAETNETVGYYDLQAEAFAQDTACADISAILNEFIAALPQGATVLDWGCGTGRDSRAMSEAGFNVISTDASQAMCRKAKELFGIDAKHERFDELDADDYFDGIWACASLLHIEKRNLPPVFRIAHKALKNGGTFYASFKYGSFEGMRAGRWYTDLDEEALTKLAGPEFEITQMWITADVRPGRAEEKWLNCLLRKRS